MPVLFRQPVTALGQRIAKALPVGYPGDHINHHVGVAEAEGRAHVALW